MAGRYRVISADSHVNPSPLIYRERLPKRFQDRAPRIEQRGEYEVMVFEGEEKRFGLLSNIAGAKYKDYKWDGKTFQEGRKGGWDPHERIKDQDLDGVDAEVVYGSNTGGGLKSKDPEFWFALMQAYNDWLADFCAAYPKRLIGIVDVPYWDLEMAILETKRAAKKGLRGILLPSIPERAYTDPWWEPLWDTAEEMGLSINMHLGANPLTPGLRQHLMVYVCANKTPMIEPICSLIFSGVLERHPKLKMVSVESMVGWMAWLVPWMDNVFERNRYITKSELKEMPSFYFQRQITGTFMEDPVGIRERRTIGVGSIMWSSDYPHSLGTFPNSRKVIDEHCAGIPQAEKELIAGGNAARLYGL